MKARSRREKLARSSPRTQRRRGAADARCERNLEAPSFTGMAKINRAIPIPLWRNRRTPHRLSKRPAGLSFS
jgi:hypothetical protein